MIHTTGDTAAHPAALGTVRNPIVVVTGFAEVAPAVQWVSRLQAHQSLRVTFAHVIDTGPFIRDFGTSGVAPVEFISDARRDGERILDTLRRTAPRSVSVTTRLLEAPHSCAAQILRAVARIPCCDAIVVCSAPDAGVLSRDGRMIRSLRVRSSVPLIVVGEPSRPEVAVFSLARKFAEQTLKAKVRTYRPTGQKSRASLAAPHRQAGT